MVRPFLVMPSVNIFNGVWNPFPRKVKNDPCGALGSFYSSKFNFISFVEWMSFWDHLYVICAVQRCEKNTTRACADPAISPAITHVSSPPQIQAPPSSKINSIRINVKSPTAKITTFECSRQCPGKGSLNGLWISLLGNASLLILKVHESPLIPSA